MAGSKIRVIRQDSARCRECHLRVVCQRKCEPASVTRPCQQGRGGGFVTRWREIVFPYRMSPPLGRHQRSCYQAVFLERMSVFLRSTLDAGEVEKRGEGGGQLFFIHTHTHHFGGCFLSLSHNPLAPVVMRHARRISLSLSIPCKSSKT